MDPDVRASLRDELGLAIEAVMAVTPAPSLAAQVRARVDRERSKSAVSTMWPLTAWATLAVLVASGAALTLLFRAQETTTSRMIAAAPLNATVPYVAGAQPAPVWIDIAPTARRTGPAQVFSSPTLSPQAAALRDYVAYLRNSGSAAEASSPTPPLTLPAITLEPIAIDPLPQLDAIAGERQ